MKSAFPLILAVLSSFGCSALDGYEKDINKGGQEIAAAGTDAERAAGHIRRGRGYAEKARYLRAFKRISFEDYVRLFDSGAEDGNRAVALSAADARAYEGRGLNYYYRAWPMPPDDLESKSARERWLVLAEADYKKATELDPQSSNAFDMLGLIHHSRPDYDAAIKDFERVLALEPRLGKLRLSDTYCERGTAEIKDKRWDAAIADLEKSVGYRVISDGCDCDPYWPLAGSYFERKDYAASWRVVHAAKGQGYIAPEFLEQLKKESGREN